MNTKRTSITLLTLCLMLLSTLAIRAGVVPVTTAADGASGSLRSAIDVASPGDTIIFQGSVNQVPLNLTSGAITIDKPLVILGNGISLTILSGENSSRIFNITNAGEVTLMNMYLEDGMADYGGAIRSENSSVVIMDCTLYNNRATVSGGAIYKVGGDLVVDDCFILSNRASGNGTTEGGGGIANLAGSVTVQGGSSIAKNKADGTSGSGGGILNGMNGSLTVVNSQILQNTSNRAGGGIEDNSGTATNVKILTSNIMHNRTGFSPGNGGGVHITGAGDLEICGGMVRGNRAGAEGGGLWNGTGTMTVTTVLIERNIANGNAADQGGGGVFNAGGTVIIERKTTIRKNVADGNSGSGGGILNDAGGTLMVSESSVSQNTSNRAGGGIEDNSGAGTILTLTDVTMDENSTGAAPGNGGGLHITGPGDSRITGGTVSNNTASAEGGGLWNGSGTMTVDNVMIDGNIGSGDDADQGGGGLFNNGGTLIVQNSTISNNVADGSSGSGGGILNVTGGMLTVENTTLSGNTSKRAGGAIEDNSGSSTTIVLTNVTMDGNSTGAAPGNGGGLHITGPGDSQITGGTVSNNTASAEGGGLWNGSGTMTVDNVMINGNTGSGDAADQGGGGLFNNGGTLIVQNSTISNNVADGSSGSGGGILNVTGGMLTVENTTLSGNTSNRAGGAIEDNSGSSTTIVLTNVTMDGNSTGAAPGNGGGLHITGPGDSRISGGTVSNNTASAEGGGLWNGSGTMVVDNVTIDGNTGSGDDADQGGGGLFNNGGTLIVQNSTISDNVADGSSGSGGGILNVTGGMLTVENTTLSGNTSNRAGGAIEDNSGSSTTIVLTNVTMDGNSTGAAPGNGGGLHITGPGNSTIRGGVVSNNTASAEGGGLWNGSGTMTVIGTSINNNTGSGDDANQGGGGIFNAGGTLVVQGGTSISNNVADGASGSGGGILNDTGGMMTVENTTLSGNTSNRAGGAIEDNSGSSTTIILSNVAMNGNSTGASPGNGGGLHITGPGDSRIRGGMVSNNTASAEGGGLWNGSGTMIVENVMIDGNTGSGDSADQGGGGIFNAGGTVIVQEETTITNNVADGASGSGGGILNDAGGTLTVENTIITGNSSNRAGGGIEDNSGAATTVRLANVTLDANTTGAAPGNGGGIHISGAGDMTITGGTVTNNTASREGGGLWNGGGLMTIDGVSIDGNIASGAATDDGGGGVFNNGGMIEITASTISNNISDGADGAGGGIHNGTGGDVMISYSTISGNTTAGNGGGVANNGTLSIVASTIVNNAGTNGGGLAAGADAISATVSSSIIAGNTAGGMGADVSDTGTLTSNGYNLVGQDDAGAFNDQVTDIEGTAATPVDPMLGPLADNGGNTQTHALLCGSPAIDAGNPNNASEDQRGEDVFGGQRDIGSFELQDDCMNGLVAPGQSPDESIEAPNLSAANTLSGSTLYPNPSATTEVTLEIPQHFGEAVQISVTDLTGAVLYTQQTTYGRETLKLEGFTAGTYLVRITVDQAVETHKLILMD